MLISTTSIQVFSQTYAIIKSAFTNLPNFFSDVFLKIGNTRILLVYTDLLRKIQVEAACVYKRRQMATVTNKYTEDSLEANITEHLNNINKNAQQDSITFHSSDDKKESASIDKKITWRHLLISPCLMLHLYSYLFYSFVFTQYIYHRIQIDNNLSISSNETLSKCNETNESETTRQDLIDLQKQAANLTLYNSLALSIPAIFFELLIISISDRYGRKIPIIITLLGTFLKTILAAIGIYFKFNIYIFILYSFIEGITGGWCCVLALGLAYVSDLTKSGHNRTLAIVLLNVSVGLGLVLSGVTSGYIIKGVGFFYAMALVTLSNCINLLMVSVLLPETYSSQDAPKTDQMIKNAFMFYMKKSSNMGKRWKYLVCISIFATMTCGNIGRDGTDSLYQLDRPFCWDSVKIGWYASLNNVAQNIIGLSTIRFFQIVIRDEIIGVICAISNILSSCLEAFAFNDLTMFLGK